MNKWKKIAYWFFTIWMALGMVSTGGGQLFKMKAGQGGLDMMTHLGYPAYVMAMLGACKILAVIIVLVPKLPLLKEWAYAGLCFIMAGAIFSHIAAGDALGYIIPSTSLLILTLLSWYLRPANRKVFNVAQQNS